MEGKRTFTYTIEPMYTDYLGAGLEVVGGKTVKYWDKETGQLLGGWETMKDDAEIGDYIEKNRTVLEEKFLEYWGPR